MASLNRRMMRLLQAVYYSFKRAPPPPKRCFGFRNRDETRYGYGTPDEANDYMDLINKGRKTNLYSTIPADEMIYLAVDLSKELRKDA